MVRERSAAAGKTIRGSFTGEEDQPQPERQAETDDALVAHLCKFSSNDEKSIEKCEKRNSRLAIEGVV